MHGVEFLVALRKRWVYVLIPLIVGFAGAAGYSYAQTPLYQASASVYFSLPYGQSAGDLFAGSNYTQKQLASYATLATMPVVLNPVIDELALSETPAKLNSAVTAIASNDTVLIEIRVTDPSAQLAADIANAVATELGVVVKSLSPKAANGAAAIDVETVAEASPPAKPASPNTTRNVGAGTLGGLFLGLLLAIARERFDTRFRVAKDLPGDVPILATIGFDRAAKKVPVIVEGATRSVRAEAYRQLRTNLQFVDIDNPVKVLVVTSSIPSEGKSSTATNLAIVFSEANLRVLLIEADLRRPRISDYLGLERSVGLTNILAGQVEFDEVRQSWGSGGLTVLPSGTVPPNPSELLGSQNMSDFIAEQRQSFDMIIVDTPPLLPVTDAAVASVHADGVLVVARFGKVSRSQIAETLQSLEAVDARLLGVVVNMAPTKGPSASVRYDGYGYYEEDPGPAPKFKKKKTGTPTADPALVRSAKSASVKSTALSSRKSVHSTALRTKANESDPGGNCDAASLIANTVNIESQNVDTDNVQQRREVFVGRVPDPQQTEDRPPK